MFVKHEKQLNRAVKTIWVVIKKSNISCSSDKYITALQAGDKIVELLNLSEMTDPEAVKNHKSLFVTLFGLQVIQQCRQRLS